MTPRHDTGTSQCAGANSGQDLNDQDDQILPLFMFVTQFIRPNRVFFTNSAL